MTLDDYSAAPEAVRQTYLDAVAEHQDAREAYHGALAAERACHRILLRAQAKLTQAFTAMDAAASAVDHRQGKDAP
jgi:hypothetical protein